MPYAYHDSDQRLRKKERKKERAPSQTSKVSDSFNTFKKYSTITFQPQILKRLFYYAVCVVDQSIYLSLLIFHPLALIRTFFHLLSGISQIACGYPWELIWSLGLSF